MRFWFSLLYRRQKKRVFIGIFWSFFTMICSAGLVALSGWLITATAITGLVLASGTLVKFDMYLPGAGIRYFALSRTIGRYIEKLYNHDTILRLIAFYRVKIFKSLSIKPLPDLYETSDSEWLSKLTADLDALDSLLTRYLIPTISVTVTTIVLTVSTWFVEPKFAIYTGVSSLTFLIVSIRFTIIHTRRSAIKCVSTLNMVRQEIISHLQGAPVLKSQNLFIRHQESIEQQLTTFDLVQFQFNTKTAQIQFVLDNTLYLSMVLLTFLTFQSVSLELVDGPIAVMFLLLLVGVSEFISNIPEQFSLWGKTEYACDRLQQLVDTKISSPINKLEGCDPVSLFLSNEPRIPFTYTKPIKLELQGRHQVVITGKSGTGKSTLAKFILGIESPRDNASYIYFSGFNVKDISSSELIRNTAYLEQSSSILAGSLYFNLTLGLDEVEESIITNILEILELSEWVSTLPEGINTWLGETGRHVSGGQAKRIALARILLRNPSFVVLDEPFNGLDKAMARRIFLRILPWVEKRKALLLLHEMPDFVPSDSFDVICLDE